MKKQHTSINRRTISWFWHFTKPDKHLFLASNILSAVATVVQDIVPPFIAAKAFTHIQQQYLNHQHVSFKSVQSFAWWYIAFVVTGFVLWRIQIVIAWAFEIRGQKRIFNYLFNHLQRQSAAFHADRFGGALVSNTNKFSSAYEKIMDELQWSVTPGIVGLLTTIVLLATVAPVYAGLLFLGCLSYVGLMTWLRLRDGHVDKELAVSESERTAKLADAITNIATVRSFANEAFENKLFGKQIDATANAYYRLLRVVARNEIISHSATASIGIFSFVGGLLLVSHSNAPLGVLFLVINYTLATSQRLRESNRTTRNIVRSFGDASSVTELLAIQPDIGDKPGAVTATVRHGRVVFDNVTFQYDGADKPVFKDLSLVIKPGEKVGLVGRSGGGKTTVTKLLAREAEISGGSISIDGQDIREVTLESLRRNVSLVPQEPLLFHRTIAENIAYGNHAASKQAIEGVAKMANAHDFVKLLPSGYETLVGERGVKLSGGQRQRVAIARAMLKNAPILVLDEATSALDSESEVLIQDALWRLMEGRTAIVIAHRLSTIQKMDRIVVLDAGKVIEQGSHKELLAMDGAYAKLWAHQSGGFIEE